MISSLLGNNNVFIQHIISKVNTVFTLKYLGELSFFLGIQVTMTSDALHLNQTKNIKDLLDKVQLHDSKSTSTPMIARTSLSKIDGNVLLKST